jgi:hypothetical protein
VPAAFTEDELTGIERTAAAGARGRWAQGLAGALDPARRPLVTETVVRAGGGIIWCNNQGGAGDLPAETGAWPMTERGEPLPIHGGDQGAVTKLSG